MMVSAKVGSAAAYLDTEKTSAHANNGERILEITTGLWSCSLEVERKPLTHYACNPWRLNQVRGEKVVAKRLTCSALSVNVNNSSVSEVALAQIWMTTSSTHGPFGCSHRYY